MEFERKGLNNEDENNSSSNDEETTDAISPDQLRTYFIVVNDDGTLVLDSNRVTSEDADPQTVIPVQLPINKLKSPDCPLPGATPIAGPSTGGGGRSRKSKPQAILYGGDNDDGVYEYSTTSTTSSSYQLSDQTIVTNGSAILADSTTGGTMASGTPLDIAQLGPQEIAILENVLQSEQAREFRELLENCSLQEEIPAAPAVSSHLWDHSYSALSAPLPQPPHTPTISTTQAAPRVVSTLATTASTAETTSEASTAVPPAKSIIKVSLGNVNPGKKTSPAAAKGSPSPRASPSLSSASSSPNSRRISESESASIRRSQRQQDRIERQEAERIMAENQQMLQREKEMMMENKHQQQLEVAVPQMASVSPSLSPQIMGETSSISPVPPPPAPVTPVEAKSTSPEESPRGVQRPMRQRKLPAHLADPNILQLEDEPMTTKVAVEETKTVADPNSSLTEEETTEDEEELAVEEDDPNKLWCICRQPHNNRFMICCDKCDDWFHGKCVGVTKAQAKQMEQKNIQWHCPPCRKIIKQEKAAEKGIKYVGPGRPPGRRGSETSVSSRASAEPSIKSKRGSIDIIRSPTDTPKRRDSFGAGRRRKADSTSGGDEDQIFAGCIVCGKKPRAGSVFCSDDCIRLKAGPAAIKAAKDSPSPSPSPAPSSGSSTPLNAATSPQKPKRLNSKSETEKAEPIFDFHVIQAGVSKSTEVVPAKQKEAMAKAAAALGTPSEKVPGKPPPASPSPRTQQPAGKTLPTPPPPPASSTSSSSSKDQKVSKEPEKASEKSSSKSSGTTPKSSEGISKEKKKVKESPKPEKEVTRSGKDENLMKDSFKKFIGETLKTRIKELPEDQVSSFSITPENLAVNIVEELSALYGSSINPKYKNKYRSICFNLKDQKNHLFRELLSGSLTPKTLVRMESTEMASAELSEWRNRENQKNLEMIKRAEIDKLVEAKKQELLEKGADVEVAVAVEEEARKLDIEGILDAKDAKEHEKKESNGSKSSKTHSSSSSASSSSHHRKDKKHDRHKDRHKEKHHSPKERDKTDNSRSSSKDSRSGRHHHKSSKEEYDNKSSASKTRDKDGDKRVKSSKEKDEKKYREKERKSREEIKDSKGKNEVTEDTNKTANDAGSKTEESKLTSRNSIDSEQEFPSSTIKTPDFAEDKKDVKNSAAFHTKLMMHELGSFNASAFHVSHNTLEGVYFPESPVPIVGRIAPETVWDYLDKMKKTKEVIVLRLAPESEADNDGYMTFFTYLSSRGRLGVMGGITSPLKDVYLIPLDKHSPVNRALLPFRGPGLPKDRSHCLLAVVTRHLPDFVPIAQIKRKASTTTPDATSTPVLKKKKGEAGPKVAPVLADRDPRRKDARKNNNNDDDDAPYTPWEDEDDNKPTIDAATIEGEEGKPPAPEKLLEDIERQIQQQRQEIESITSAIKLNETITHIPGLDGDFTTTKESSSSVGAKAHADVPFYLKSQPTTSKAVVMDEGSKVSAVAAPADSTEVEIIPSTEEEAGETEELATTKPVEDEEAYSPTAMDFSDDEKDGRTATRTVLMESSGSLPFEAINTTTRMDMIPGLDLSHEDPPEPESTRLSPSPPPAPEVIDLDDDEPPPPGEAPPAKAGPKISLESVFTLPPPANPNQKPKIQINLGAKSLGSSVLASVAKSAQEGDLMPSSSSMTTSSALPSFPPSVPSIPLPIGVPTNIPPPSLTPMPPTSLTSMPPNSLTSLPPTSLSPMPPTSFPPPGFQAPPMSLPPAGFPAIPPRPPPPMMMPSVVPPSALGGINLSVPPPNVSVPPPNVGVLPPNVGMVPVTSIPPLPPLRGMPPNVNRPRFGPGPGGAAPAPQQQAPGNRFRPIGGRFLEGSSSRPPYHNNGGNKRNSFNNSTGGTVVDDTKTNYRHRGSPPERHRGRYGRHRSRSRSRSRTRSRSRSHSREHRRRRRHSRSRSRSRSPQSTRRRSRSRSPPPSRRLTSRSPIARVRRRKSRSPSPSVSSSSSSSSLAIKKSQQ